MRFRECDSPCDALICDGCVYASKSWDRYLFVVNVTRGTRRASATAWIPIQGLVSASYRVLSASANAVGSSKGRLNPGQQISIAGQVATAYPSLRTTLSYEWFGAFLSGE